ncbi:MAG: hypothetical protein WCF47_11920 [Pseudolabrys sp.]
MHWIDPDCLPEFSGEVQQFIVNTRGEIDGMILWSDKLKSMLVHTPPHMAADIESTIQIGEEICVRGVRPRGADIIVAVALIAQGGLALVDHGPPKGHEDKEEQKLPDREPKKEPCETEGKVRLSLFGPKGELRGAVLDNGTIIRVGHKEATNLSEFLRPDSKVAVRGDGILTKHGRVIAVKEIGPKYSALKPVTRPNHKDKPSHKAHRAAHDCASP